MCISPDFEVQFYSNQIFVTFSTDGGKSFQNIEMNIGKEAIRSDAGIFKSPVDPKRVGY